MGATLDHILARSSGGSNAYTNLRLTHYICNNDRLDGTPHGTAEAIKKRSEERDRKRMSWSIIRVAEKEDYIRLNKTAIDMIKKYNLHVDYEKNPWYSLSLFLDITHSELASIWRKRLRRALRESSAEGIAYGYVGR